MDETLVGLLLECGFADREARVLAALHHRPGARASEVAKELDTNRLDAYNSLKLLQEMGVVTATVDRPMRFKALSVDDLFAFMERRARRQLEKLQEQQDLWKGGEGIAPTPHPEADAAQFSVVKDRSNIYATLERQFDAATDRVWLYLGRYGILHLMRSDAVASLHEAVERGVDVRILGSVERTTLRFYQQLADGVLVRHSEALDFHGCLVDDETVIQLISVEPNPVGRGRNDTALMIESAAYLEAQQELLASAWDEATTFEAVLSRLTEGTVIEPLRLTVGEGSFFQRLKDALADADDSLGPPSASPSGGLSFGNPEPRLQPGQPIDVAELETPEASYASRRIANLAHLGVDTSLVLRTVGQRIGEEIALKLADVKHDAEYLSDLADLWEDIGLGTLDFQLDPEFFVQVGYTSKPDHRQTDASHGADGGDGADGRGGDADGDTDGDGPEDELPIWHLDDGVLEGALRARFARSDTVGLRREEGEGTPDDHARYILTFAEPDLEDQA